MCTQPCGSRSALKVSGPHRQVPPARRQQLADEFAAVPGHAVLVAQIGAARGGLNMQAASVTIICEPQIKPTFEHQAVALTHRMGQVRSVRARHPLVHPWVDERMAGTEE
ncbi:hypothetical protein [Streptomyces sp. NBC_00385]|uniref:hypothetical protein n=1 Tax=Streptomyces sp. NBC_00385 TaxID=2975733 RepID=UPI003FA34581